MSKTVRMLAQISGTRDGVAWPKPGNEIILPDDEADLLIRNAQAADASAARADGTESALLDSHPEYAVTGAELPDGKQSVKARLAENPAPHADEPAAFHVPVLPGEKSAAEAGQEIVDKAQAEQGAERVISATEAAPEEAVKEEVPAVDGVKATRARTRAQAKDGDK